MEKYTIEKRSHHFIVKIPHISHIAIMSLFTKQLDQKGQIRIPGYRYPVWDIIYRYYSCYGGGKIYRFHINLLENFLDHLTMNGVPEDYIEITEKPMYVPTAVEYVSNGNMEDRDDQAEIIAAILAPKPISKFVGSQMGKGKSYISLRVAQEAGVRTFMLMKKGYMSKWEIDYRKLFKTNKDDCFAVSGTDKFIQLLKNMHDGIINPKIVIVSNSTYIKWIKSYEEKGKAILTKYPCLPDEMFEYGGFGYRVIDEVRQDFHANFMCDLYTHVPLSLSMDATLINENPFIKKVHSIAYPETERIDASMENWKRYIQAIAVRYGMRDPDRIRVKELGSSNYSHNAFEVSLMRNKGAFENYLDMIEWLIHELYVKVRNNGEKAVIYFHRIEICKMMSERVQKRYPELVVSSYTSDDPYVILITSDITFTTLGKSGTGVDIPGLIFVLLTNGLSSTSSNAQVIGRLRDSGAEALRFVFLTCIDIPKQEEYYEKKKLLLTKIAASYVEHKYDDLI